MRHFVIHDVAAAAVVYVYSVLLVQYVIVNPYTCSLGFICLIMAQYDPKYVAETVV